MSWWHTIARLNTSMHTTQVHSATHSTPLVFTINFTSTDYVLLIVLGLAMSIVSGLALAQLIKNLHAVEKSESAQGNKRPYLEVD